MSLEVKAVTKDFGATLKALRNSARVVAKRISQKNQSFCKYNLAL